MASAVSAVALAIAFVGTEYFVDVTQTHGIVVQGSQRLLADAVVSAPGSGLAPGALQAITPGHTTRLPAPEQIGRLVSAIKKGCQPQSK